MSEKEDELTIELGDNREFVMSRYNSRLYTFLGGLSTRNHVFLETGGTEGKITYGAYVFAHNEAYGVLCQFAVQHSFPMSLNNVAIEKADEEAFQRSLEQLEDTAGSSIEDYFPEGWENE